MRGDVESDADDVGIKLRKDTNGNEVHSGKMIRRCVYDGND